MRACMTQPTTQTGDTPAGFGFAVSAYVLWGFLPLYLKSIAHIAPVEVVAHRIIWSVPIAAGVLIWLGRTSDIKAALSSPRMLAMGCITALLITMNWSLYVYAIAAERALDGALGYYINPLFSVLLGAVLLGERPNLLQSVAIGLAALAVVVLTIDAGGLPWLALALPISFGFYGFFKKWLSIGPNQGFLLEVILLLPFALGYVVWLEWQGGGAFWGGSPMDIALLLGCGPVTAIPLMLYANGAKRLRLTTIAMLQYIAPTMILLIAVFVFNEPFGAARMIAFPMIWGALVIYTYSLLRGRVR